MPRSSKHKSRRQSKHSSRDCSDSEDTVKMKEKISKDDGSTRVHKETSSGGKRKISFRLREGKEISGHGNGAGDVVEGYFSSKRRKEKTDVSVGDDRWDGGVDERHLEKELHKVEVLKPDKLKESSSKGESLRVESKSKSGRHDSGIAGEKKDNSSVFVVVEKEESRDKGESKRKSERDASLRKEGKESKEKDRRSEKEKSKIGDAEVKLVDMDVGKKEGAQLVDLCGERQSKRSRENNERPSLDKDMDNKIRKKRRGSDESAKYYDESKESDGKRVSSKGDRAKDLKNRDDKHKDDKYQEDGHRDDRRRDAKYREETDKENKHYDDEYHEVTESEARREDKYHKDGARDYRRKDDQYHEDDDKGITRGDERYYEDGDRDDKRRYSSFRDDGDKDHGHKDDKYREDIERDIRYKDSKQGVMYDREKRSRDSKYRDEQSLRDVSDLKRYREDGYAADHHDRSNKVSRHDDDDSPSRDDRATRYRDDQGRRRTNEKEDYNDVKSRVLKDQISDAEKKSVSSARTSGHARRRSSPTSSSHASRDNYRAVKQDDTKYRDYNYENRSRHNINSTRDHYTSEKTSSSRSLDKHGKKDDSHFGETPAERSGGSRAEELVPVPPSFRNDGVDSKRMGNHNMGWMQGNNAWRGVPSWSPLIPNGFLPFPQASPFPSVMQPFHTQIPFHMPSDTNMFSRPMLNGWDMSNAIYGDESHMYGRWETSTDLWKGPNGTGSLEMIPSDKGNNNSIPSEEDGALADEHTQVNQKSDSINGVAQSTKSIEKNEIGDSTIFSSGVSGDGAMASGPFCRFYLSKLDVSEELAESEVYDKCMGLSDTDKIKCSGIDDSKILYMEDPDDKMTSSGLLRFPPFDDSVFKKAMSLYKIQKESLMAEYGEKPKVTIPNSDQDQHMQEDQSEKLCLADDVHVLEDKTESLDTNYSPLRKSDVLSSVNLSRIHDSPGKSTH